MSECQLLFNCHTEQLSYLHEMTHSRTGQSRELRGFSESVVIHIVLTPVVVESKRFH